MQAFCDMSFRVKTEPRRVPMCSAWAIDLDDRCIYHE